MGARPQRGASATAPQAVAHHPKPQAAPTLQLQELTFTEFRSYEHYQVRLTQNLVAIVGANGAGKTNFLEAISLLGPGRGLRSADAARFLRQQASAQRGDDKSWAVSAALLHKGERWTLGVGAAPEQRRQYRLNQEPAQARALGELMPQLHLTPTSELFFGEEKSHRRRFLDRFASGLDAAHTIHLRDYDKCTRERMRLLQDGQSEPSWLESLEASMSEHGTAVARARLAALDAMCRGLDEINLGDFPRAQPAIVGAVEHRLRDAPPADVQTWFAAELAGAREHDARSGITQTGPHRSDLRLHEAGAPPASTGEQKARLLSLLLAQAHILAQARAVPPLLLLDEALVHLDSTRRQGLVRLLASGGGQVFLTANDAQDLKVLQDFGGALQEISLP